MDDTALRWLLGIAATALVGGFWKVHAMIAEKLSTVDYERERTDIRGQVRDLNERADRLRAAVEDRAKSSDLSSLWGAHHQMQRQVSGLEARMSEMAEAQRGANRRLDEIQPDVKKILEQMSRISAQMQIRDDGGQQ